MGQPEAIGSILGVELISTLTPPAPVVEITAETHDQEHGQDEAPEIRTSLFSLDFSEFPFAHLTKRIPGNINKHEIQYTDNIVGKNGEAVPRHWIIKSSAPHGLGGPSSVDVFFELLQIWKEDNFASDRIHIGTYYNLIKRLKWGMNGRCYTQLKKDLQSLYGLEIEAKNACYDKKQGKYVDSTFKPFIGWKTWKNEHDTEDNPEDYGYIQVHPDFHHIFVRSMYHLPFNATYFHGMTPHEQKLALYLTKIFNPYLKKIKSTYSRDIYELCEQLPIYGTPTKQKYYLGQAAKKLVDRGFCLLEDYRIEGSQITFINRQQVSMFLELYDNNKKDRGTINYLTDEITKVCGNNYKYYDHYKWIATNIPDGVIFQNLSIAKTEGRPAGQLFNYLISQYIDEKKKKLNHNAVEVDYEHKCTKKEVKDEHKERKPNKAQNPQITKAETEAMAVFERKETFFDTLSDEIKKELTDLIKSTSPYLKDSADDSNIVIASIIHDCITDDLKIIRNREFICKKRQIMEPKND